MSKDTISVKELKKIALALEQKVMKNTSSRIKHNKPLLFSALSAHNISRVEVSFDGSGDSGQMEEAEFFRGVGSNEVQVDSKENVGGVSVEGALISNESTWDPKKREWVYTTKTPTISELIESVCYDLLENNHGGWEINSGSYGKFVLNVVNTGIELEYNERVESVEEHNETY